MVNKLDEDIVKYYCRVLSPDNTNYEALLQIEGRFTCPVTDGFFVSIGELGIFVDQQIAWKRHFAFDRFWDLFKEFCLFLIAIAVPCREVHMLSSLFDMHFGKERYRRYRTVPREVGVVGVTVVTGALEYRFYLFWCLEGITLFVRHIRWDVIGNKLYPYKNNDNK